MQKWEYLTIRVNANFIVTEIDKVPTAKWEGGFFSGKKLGQEPVLIEYLNDVGELGWELVAINPIAGGANYVISGYQYTFKRPK
jgi:hypothetical protein